MDQITYQVLLGHIPWLQAPEQWTESVQKHLPQLYVPRALSSVWKREKNKVHLVIGPRQSGKSTLIWHHLSTQSDPFLTINALILIALAIRLAFNQGPHPRRDVHLKKECSQMKGIAAFYGFAAQQVYTATGFSTIKQGKEAYA